MRVPATTSILARTRRYDLDAGIAHEDIDPAKHLDGSGCCGFDLRLIGDVDGERLLLAPPSSAAVSAYFQWTDHDDACL
jgi:hypothetical protein